MGRCWVDVAGGSRLLWNVLRYMERNRGIIDLLELLSEYFRDPSVRDAAKNM